MSSNRTCKTLHGWAKPCVEQAFARIEASLLIRHDRPDSFACLTMAELSAAINAEITKCWSTPVGIFERADRPGESVQYDNCHRNQSGVTRSRQSSKKPRR
jgi:hypothetical protein